MIEVLGPEERREIDRLRRALKLRKGPEFHMVVGDTRRVVDAALAEALPGVVAPQATVAPEEPPKAFAVRWMKWLEEAIQESGAQPLVLDAWDVDPEHTEHWAWVFGRLNERRNEIMRALGRPFLLLISPDNERLFGNMAPDLGSIRGIGMRLHDRGRVAVDRGEDEVDERSSGPRPQAPDELDLQRARAQREHGSAPSIALAIDAIRLAQALHEARDDAAAMASADVAIAHYEALAHQDDDKLVDLARALLTRATIAAALGRRDAALHDLRRSASVLEGLLRQEPDRADHLLDLRTTYEALGDLYMGWRQEDLAQSFYEQARTVDALVLGDSESARLVVRQVGYPPAMIPAFRNARVFWDEIVRGAHDGVTPGGFQAFVRGVLTRYRTRHPTSAALVHGLYPARRLRSPPPPHDGDLQAVAVTALAHEARGQAGPHPCASRNRLCIPRPIGPSSSCSTVAASPIPCGSTSVIVSCARW